MTPPKAKLDEKNTKNAQNDTKYAQLHEEVGKLDENNTKKSENYESHGECAMKSAS